MFSHISKAMKVWKCHQLYDSNTRTRRVIIDLLAFLIIRQNWEAEGYVGSLSK